MHSSLLLLTLALLGIFGAMPARSEEQANQAPTPETVVPNSAFYGGVGVGGAITTYGDQYVYNVGTSQIYKGAVLESTGTAGGPAIPNPYLPSSSSVVPAAQLGYFSKFKNSSWLWGTKFTYSYLGTSSAPQVLAIPQAGASTNPSQPTFTGTSYNTYSIRANSQFALMPFIGKAFKRGFVYGGAGVALTQVQTSLNDVVGYAVLGGVNTNVSGAPQNFTGSQWAYGVAATAGVTYFLSKSVFLDLNYTFSKPNASTVYTSQPYSNPATSPSGTSFYGTLNGSATSNLTTNVILLTINTKF
jgi:opacity protein-like surface antigen